MKLTTTFWSKEVHEFSNLLYINGSTNEIVFEADLGDLQSTYGFFQNLSRFVKSKAVQRTIYADYCKKETYYQFAVQKDNEIIPIKWFNLVISDKCVISHDIAFDTTLIKKNNLRQTFGNFPHYYYNKNPSTQLAKYREFNVKSRAFKYIANQLKKHFMP